MLRLSATLLLFDTYLKWLRLGGRASEDGAAAATCEDESTPLLAVPLARVTPALLLSLSEQLLFCAVVGNASQAMGLSACPWYALAATVLHSSFGKCFALLHMIWSYPDAFAHAVEGFVLSSNCVALTVQLRCTTRQAAVLVAAGGAAKAALALVVSLTLPGG